VGVGSKNREEVRTMETGLAILLALGIFVGIPAIIGFGIIGAAALTERVRMAREAKAGRVETKVAKTKLGVIGK